MLEKYSITQTTLRVLGLYAGDYEKSLHLREISRRARADVKTVQLQLKRLEDINVVSSRTKGRNKEYFLNLDNVLARYHMVMAETFASISCIRENFVIKKVVYELGGGTDGIVVLFGSFARGDYTEESDIDLLVIGGKIKNSIPEAARAVDRQINVQSTTKAGFLSSLRGGDPLMREIASDHVVLRGTDEFCDMMWSYHAAQ